jgi:hypothetical protein
MRARWASWWFLTAPTIDVVWVWSDSLRRGYWVTVWSAIATACGLLMFGSKRLGTPVFEVVRNTGGRWVWGGLFLLIALALLHARTRSARYLIVTLLGAAFVYLLWGISFLESAIADTTGTVSPLGIIVQTTVAAFHISHALAYTGTGTTPGTKPFGGGTE